MFDRHATRSPEEQLDRWLDALNDPTHPAPPPPDGIAAVAGIARRYQQVLGATPAHAGAHTTIPERNGHMNAALPLPTSPNRASWEVTTPAARHRSRSRTAGWLGWLSTSLSTAVVIGLILAMGGAMIYQQNGLPGGSDDPASAPGFAASPEATPANGSLSCASPGYRAVLEGDFAPGDLAMLGGSGNTVRSTDDGVVVPLASGDERQLPPDSSIVPRSDIALAIHEDNSATVTRISTGETWEFGAVQPRVPRQAEDSFSWDYFSNGRYVIGPTDDSRTDWRILDTATGESRTTSEILGAPFQGALDLFPRTSSSNHALWIVYFTQTVFPGQNESPPAEHVESPGYLVIPGSLDDAWFWETFANDANDEIIASPEGASFISTQVVRDPKTGERLDTGPDNLTYFGKFLDYLDESTLLTYRDDAVNTVDIETGVATPIYTASSDIVAVAWSLDDHRLAVGTGSQSSLSWVLLDIDSRETTPLPGLDGYQLAHAAVAGSIERTSGTAAFIQFDSEERSINVRALDLQSGTISPPVTTITSNRDQDESQVPTLHLGRFIWTTDEGGLMTFIDATSGSIVKLPRPEGVAAPEGGRLSLSVPPGGNCVTLTPSDESNQPVGNTWIAPVTPGGEWTALPFTITNWVKAPVTSETETLPAQEIPATISAPQASPAANNTTLSCASPGYRPVVKGDVDTSDLAMIGTTAEPIILNNGDVTITATNGTEITFAEGENFYRQGNVVLTGGDKGEPTTVTSLVTGESWTFPPTDQSPNQFSTGTVQIPPWLIGPTDDSQTEWRIINTTTGEERLTSDLFGGPLDHISQPAVPGPWAYNASPSAIVHFVPEGVGDSDIVAPVVVLPSANPDDAYALDDIHASAGWTGAMTSDGSRIAYVTEDAFRVLDGFTGEQLAEYPLPKSGGFYETIGFTADDSKLILQFNQQIWTVDLATGETVSVFDPGAQIQSLELDNTTGTIIASAGDRGQPPLFWIDPLTAEVKPLATPLPLRPPQPQFGWALFQTRDADQIGVGFSLLDMATGEIATTTQVASGDDNGTNVIIIGGGDDPAGIYAVRAEPDSMLVLDGPGGQSFELPIPDGARQQTSSVAIGFSPNRACLYYTEVALPGEEEGGTSWVAPLNPDAAWTQLPFELADFWAPIEPAPVPEATPAATPAPSAASPVATPGS